MMTSLMISQIPDDLSSRRLIPEKLRTDFPGSSQPNFILVGFLTITVRLAAILNIFPPTGQVPDNHLIGQVPEHLPSDWPSS